MSPEPTPVGQSAVDAGQARPIRKPEDEAAPVTQAGDRVASDGATPVGQTAAQTPTPPPEPVSPEAKAARLKQSVANLALLARQAIGNQYPSMTCDPKQVADFCAEYERMAASEGMSSGSVAPPDGALEHAKEEGRREAIAGFAEEKAQLLQRIAELEGSKTPESIPAAQPEGFRGPGQPG